jgi:hypothetical protein
MIRREVEVRHPVTPVKVEPVQMTVLGNCLHVTCGDFLFRIQNHPYAAKLGALENERLQHFLSGEAHRIANWFERMKREVNP